MRRSSPAFSSAAICLFAISCFQSPLMSLAQETPAVDPAGMVPAQTLASISLWPKDLAASPSMKLAPLEVITAFGIESFGVDPLTLQRVDLLIGMPGPTGPQLGLLIQSSQAIDLSKLNPDMLMSEELVDDKGFKYLSVRGPEGLIIHQLNETTIVAGSLFFSKAMVKSPAKKNDIAGVLAAIQSKQDALAVVSIKTLRPLLEGFAETAPLPPEVLEDLTTVIASVEFAALRVLLGSEEKLQLVVAASDANAAANVEKSLANVLRFAVDQILSELQTQMRGESMTQKAMLAYMERVSGEMLAALQPTRTDNRLVYEVNDFQQANLAATLTGLLLPAVQSARFSARNMQSTNNMKQLGLAMHNFESAYRQLPAAGGIGDDGQPMLSWRVAILPFIEEAELFQRFRLDEPWDSEHNLALLEEMPDVFKHPNRKTEPGYTVYVAPIGEDTLLQATEPSRFQQITDGTSNTIMLVEVSEDRAVPWTAPQDYDVDEEEPGAGLFVNGIFNAVFGDGSVRAIEQATVDIDMLRALFTRSGGEVFEFP